MHSIQTTTPLRNRCRDDGVVQQPPLPQQTFFQLLHIMNPRVVDHLLKHTPDAVVHQIQIWWITWPHLWRDKLWRLSLQHGLSVTCTMCRCPSLPKNVVIPENRADIRQKHIQQNCIPVIVTVDLNPWFQDMQLRSTKTRHCHRNHQRLRSGVVVWMHVFAWMVYILNINFEPLTFCCVLFVWSILVSVNVIGINMCKVLILVWNVLLLCLRLSHGMVAT